MISPFFFKFLLFFRKISHFFLTDNAFFIGLRTGNKFSYSNSSRKLGY